jgi:hypothetical protein
MHPSAFVTDVSLATQGDFGRQTLDDQGDDIETPIAHALCVPFVRECRFNGEFSVPQATVMGADIADGGKA